MPKLKAAAEAWKPHETYVFVSSIWQWPAKAELEDLDANPREEELIKTLQERGVPQKNIVHLQGRKSSKKAMIKELKALIAKCPEGGTFLFYFQGHSLSEKDELLMCSYDYDSDRPWDSSFRSDVLWDLLQDWKGDRLILFGDTCYSGVLRKMVDRFDKERPKVKAATLPSAMASNTSTAAWTYTNALIMGFSGYWFSDKNQNGTVTFTELEQLVRGEMKFGEDQLTRAFKTRAWKDELILGSAEAWPSAARKDLAFELGHYLEAQSSAGDWLGARIVGFRSQTPSWKVHFCGFTEEENEWVDLERLRPFERAKLRVGREYQVLWDDGKWRTAKLVRNMEDFFYYAEYGDGELSEWVTALRIRGDGGKPRREENVVKPELAHVEETVRPVGKLKSEEGENSSDQESSIEKIMKFMGRVKD